VLIFADVKLHLVLPDDLLDTVSRVTCLLIGFIGLFTIVASSDLIFSIVLNFCLAISMVSCPGLFCYFTSLLNLQIGMIGMCENLPIAYSNLQIGMLAASSDL